MRGCLRSSGAYLGDARVRRSLLARSVEPAVAVDEHLGLVVKQAAQIATIRDDAAHSEAALSQAAADAEAPPPTEGESPMPRALLLARAALLLAL